MFFFIERLHSSRGRWADAESVCSAVLKEGLDSKAQDADPCLQTWF